MLGDGKAQVNRDAIGSTIILNSGNNRNIWREIHSTTGYLSVHPKEQHFGLGADKKASVEVRWSNGEVYVLNNLKANSTYEITYPSSLRKKYSKCKPGEIVANLGLSLKTAVYYVLSLLA